MLSILAKHAQVITDIIEINIDKYTGPPVTMLTPHHADDPIAEKNTTVVKNIKNPNEYMGKLLYYLVVTRGPNLRYPRFRFGENSSPKFW